jgi:hypothetical protein
MSAFVIFVIVLTLGYILYYAALITIDMTAKQKSDAATEENIDADGYSEDDVDDDVVPRNVIDNTETGGFSFSPSVPVIEEPAEIDEADEEEPLSAQTEDVVGNTVEDAVEEDTDEASEEPSDVPAKEEQETDEQVSEEEAPVEEPSEQPMEEEPVSGIEYYQEKPEDDTDKNDFDVNDAFDPDLMTPKYGVTELVEPPVSDEAQEKANMVNASLLSIASKGNQMDSFDLTRVIREQRAEQLNIETHDEVTNY